MPSWPVTGGLWQGKPFLELLQSLLIISLWLQDWVKQSPLESMICRKKNHKCHLTDWEQVEAHLNLHDACLQPLSLRSIAPPTLIFFFFPVALTLQGQCMKLFRADLTSHAEHTCDQSSLGSEFQSVYTKLCGLHRISTFLDDYIDQAKTKC
jgi:hypothetical protein